MTAPARAPTQRHPDRGDWHDHRAFFRTVVQRGHRRHGPRRGRRESPLHLRQQRLLHNQPGAGNLHFYHVSGCNGHIKNGDSMTYTDSLGIRANGGQGGGSGINVITSP